MVRVFDAVAASAKRGNIPHGGCCAIKKSPGKAGIPGLKSTVVAVEETLLNSPRTTAPWAAAVRLKRLVQIAQPPA
jgi:hypothetical protein